MVIKTRTNRTKYLRLLEADMRFCGLSESTKHQYRLVVNRYLDFTGNDPDFSRGEIMQFVASLGNVTSTYSAWVLTLIKRFHKTIRDALPEDKRKWPLGPRDGPKPKVRPQPEFNEVVINRLLKIIKNSRDYAIARLLFATGMRRDELCRLRRTDYDGKNIFIRMVKGEEFRSVKLDNTTIEAIDNYLVAREDMSLTLFVNSYGKPLTPDALSQVFKKYFKGIDAEKRTGLHAFRRGLVTLLYNRGMGETSIQKWGGWKTGEMVRRYIQLSPSRLGEEVISVHPFYEGE